MRDFTLTHDKLIEAINLGYELDDNNDNWYGIEKTSRGYIIRRNGIVFAEVSKLNQVKRILSQEGCI